VLSFNAKGALDIFFNCLKVQRTSNIVSRDNYIFVINTNEISYYVQLDALEGTVDTDNISAGILNKVFYIINAHEDYDLYI